MNGAGSLRRRLTALVVGVVGASLAMLCATLYVIFSGQIRERFDDRLAQEAHTIALMVKAGEGGAWQPETASLGPLDQTRGATTYEVWTDDGSRLARSPLAEIDLPRPPEAAAPRFTRIELPNGRPARLYQAWLELGQEDAGSGTGRRVAVAVARDTAHLDRRIARLRLMLWGPTLGTVVLAALFVSLAIRRSLRQVTGLSARIDSIDVASLANRLPLDGVPDELKPPFVKLNEMLARLEESLGRERQFTADVSHELRTPLAGLRNILEVSTSRERPASAYRTSISDALQVVQQLEKIVESLLLLAQIGSGQMKGNRHEKIRLRDFIDSCFAAYAGTAQSRRLRFENRIASELSVDSDRVKLGIIAANLLSNAAEYTTEGGWIAVESDPARRVVLTVRDSGPRIPERHVARLFDPFFRVDGSRSGGGEHLGIGLTLVKGLCDTLGYRVNAGNEADGTVQFTVALASDSTPGEC